MSGLGGSGGHGVPMIIWLSEGIMLISLGRADAITLKVERGSFIVLATDLTSMQLQLGMYNKRYVCVLNRV